MKLDLKTAFKIFTWGIDYGQLKMEEKRDNEDLFNAFNGMLFDKKFSMPAKDVPHRLPHSENWRKAKEKSFKNFTELVEKIIKEEETNVIK